MTGSNILLLASALLIAPIATAQCNQYPVLNLGNDTVLCPGNSYMLQAQSGYDTYSWSTGSTLDAITVNSAGVYTLEVMNIGTNLVVNGDFESGNTGFTSSYTVGAGGAWGQLSNPGTYAINTSPSNVHTNFSSCSDHTPTGPGNMLIANGASTPNVSVWCQTITVDPNTDYLFSAWIGNALNDPNVSNLQFFINNVQLGNIFSTDANACNWTEFNEVWNSGALTTADLCIRNQNTSGGGNDFVLDDITFRPVCLQIDSVQVSYDPLSIDAGPDIAFCANETDNFIATSNTPNTSFLWENGVAGSTMTPTASGTYTVSAISQSGCLVQDSAVATITPMPWDIDTIYVGQTSCGANNGYVSAITNGSFNDPPMYTWNGPGVSNPNSVDASVWTDLGVGWYYVVIESAGCYRYDSAFVSPLNPPTAGLSASIISGCSPLNVTFTNSSQNASSYEWDFGNGQTTTTNDLSSQDQTFTSSSTVQMIAVQGDCSDTAYISIDVDICGCTDPNALNYDPAATADNGSCQYAIPPTPTVETYNVFTPDENGDNPVFFVKTTNTENVELTIINRWGNVVFKGTGANPVWDGKIGGANADEGVYFYKYTVKGLNGDVLEGHGFVQLIR